MVADTRMAENCFSRHQGLCGCAIAEWLDPACVSTIIEIAEASLAQRDVCQFVGQGEDPAPRGVLSIQCNYGEDRVSDGEATSLPDFYVAELEYEDALSLRSTNPIPESGVVVAPPGLSRHRDFEKSPNSGSGSRRTVIPAGRELYRIGQVTEDGQNLLGRIATCLHSSDLIPQCRTLAELATRIRQQPEIGNAWGVGRDFRPIEEGTWPTVGPRKQAELPQRGESLSLFPLAQTCLRGAHPASRLLWCKSGHPTCPSEHLWVDLGPRSFRHRSRIGELF